MSSAIDPISETMDRHPRMRVGVAVAVYVWQYALRLVHWGLVLSIGVLSVTGYYIHNPFVVGQTSTTFLMGWIRFVHEAFGMAFIGFFLIRMYLFFAGDRWVRWQAMVPLHKKQWKEMFEVIFFRNVMIYFNKPTQEAVINKLCRNLVPGGFLFVGHSESLAGLNLPVKSVAPAVYRKPS